MSNFELGGDILIEQAAQGDSNAFSSLYDTYAEKIYRHVCYRVPDRADAEDITQEVFIRAWRAVGRYRNGKTPFFSWLLVIARNLVADFYRIRKNHALLDGDAPYASGIDIEKEVEASQKKDELQQAISKLNKVKQKVLIMRFIEDRSYPEISRALGKSEGAVRVLVFRALMDLKKIIGSHQGSEIQA
ncbi:MAG: RNA polymerase sigma factor [Dehalococcoidales bacterium]|nr:RNA polymerase sigma factor [Dehalococcoidales bacterium]